MISKKFLILSLLVAHALSYVSSPGGKPLEPIAKKETPTPAAKPYSETALNEPTEKALPYRAWPTPEDKSPAPVPAVAAPLVATNATSRPAQAVLAPAPASAPPATAKPDAREQLDELQYQINTVTDAAKKKSLEAQLGGLVPQVVKEELTEQDVKVLIEQKRDNLRHLTQDLAKVPAQGKDELKLQMKITTMKLNALQKQANIAPAPAPPAGVVSSEYDGSPSDSDSDTPSKWQAPPGANPDAQQQGQQQPPAPQQEEEQDAPDSQYQMPPPIAKQQQQQQQQDQQTVGDSSQTNTAAGDSSSKQATSGDDSDGDNSDVDTSPVPDFGNDDSE